MRTLFLAAPALAIALTACSGSSEPEAPPVEESTPEPAPMPTYEPLPEPSPEPTPTPMPTPTPEPLPDEEQMQEDADAVGMTSRIDRSGQGERSEPAD
ncbi:hypothetical protein [Sphingomonas sp.]